MIQLTPKDPQEQIPVTFDFSELCSVVNSATVTVAIKSGTDAAAASMADGAAVLSGANVQQQIINGVDGVNYYLRAEAVSPEGTFALVGVLPVVNAEKQ